MLVVRVSDAYTITPGPDDVRPGTMGLWFTTDGTATVVTTVGGNTITVGGQAGTFFECPIVKVTSATATVLGVLGR